MVSFGCMSLGPDHSANAALIHKAIDEGIDFFDTADLYDKGQNEISVGKALKDKRDRVKISTKVGNRWRNDGSGWDWVPSKKYILSAIDESLKRLQTNYVDLYLLHGGTIEDPIDDIIEAFESLQQNGKIRQYGISSIRPNVIREYVSRSNISAVMMQYSLLDRRPEETCLPLLKQHNIGVLSRGSVAKGLLAGKPPAPFLNYSAEQVAAAAKAVKEISNINRDAAQTALRFVLDNPAITSAVTGIRTVEQLMDNIKANAAPSLTNQERSFLENSIPINYYTEHR
jgi:aryl-alcohol dehydrogenase-like predicted oxidoreductase